MPTEDTLSKTDIEKILKRKVVDKIANYIPDGCKLTKKLMSMKLIPDGREYVEPICLSNENGATYGDDTDFTYNDSINGIYDELTLDSNPFVMKSKLNLKAFNRLTKDEMTISKGMGQRMKNLKKSTCKRLELSYWYGGTSLARTTAVAPVAIGGSTTQFTIKVTATTFAENIWGGMKNALYDFYDADNATKVNTAGPVKFLKVNVLRGDPDYRMLTFEAFNAADRTAIIANTTSKHIYFFGAFGKEMLGIDVQISKQTGSLFGVSKDEHESFRGHIHNCNGTWSFAEMLKGLSGAVAVGGLEEDITVYMHTHTFEMLNIDESALREYDSSYSPDKIKKGSKKIEFMFQGGTLTLVPHLMIKHGEAFAFPDRVLKKIGATDLNFITNAKESGEKDSHILRALENSAGYQILYGYDHCLLISEVVLCTKYENIVTDS